MVDVCSFVTDMGWGRWQFGFAICVSLGCGPLVEPDAGEGGSTGSQESGSEATGGTDTVDPSGGEVGDTTPSDVDSGDPEPLPPMGVDVGREQPPWVDEARELYPTFRALFDGPLAGSCAAFQGICHATGADNPKLTTPEDYLGLFGQGCNLDELQERSTNMDDGCERSGGWLGWHNEDTGWQGAEIGWIDIDEFAERAVIVAREVPDDAALYSISTVSEGMGDYVEFLGSVLGNELHVDLRQLGEADSRRSSRPSRATPIATASSAPKHRWSSSRSGRR